jgi:heptosyltransferase-3
MIGKKPRILVFRGGAIGDFILTLPALWALRKLWPDAYIELVGYPHIADLGVAGQVINRVESLDRADFARFFAAGAELTPERVAYIRSFDLVLSYLFDPDGLFQTNLLRAGARQVLYGNPVLRDGHAIEHLMKPLETLAIYPDGDTPRLELADPIRQRGRQWLEARKLGRVAMFHPGSGSPRKNWPLESYIQLARALRKRKGYEPLFVVGEADRALGEDLQVKAPDIQTAGDLTLTELAGVLVHGLLYVGNDSGITHLAAALGLPVIALFGPTDPAGWGPRGGHVRIVQADEGRLEQVSARRLLEMLAG